MSSISLRLKGADMKATSIVAHNALLNYTSMGKRAVIKINTMNESLTKLYQTALVNFVQAITVIQLTQINRDMK